MFSCLVMSDGIQWRAARLVPRERSRDQPSSDVAPQAPSHGLRLMDCIKCLEPSHIRGGSHAALILNVSDTGLRSPFPRASPRSFQHWRENMREASNIIALSERLRQWLRWPCAYLSAS